jgi:hypothetical protein
LSRHLAKLLQDHLEDYVKDTRVTEISLNTDGRLWVEKAGDNYMVDAGQTIDTVTARNICQDLAGENALSEKTPLAGSDFEAFDSLWRTQVVLNPVVEKGPAFTLRRNVVQNFTLDELCAGLEPSDLDDLFSDKVNPADAAVMAAYEARDVSAFLRLATQAKWNILFSGGTSSGKTTWLRAIRAGNYDTWPHLSAKAVAKHFPESDETQQGHMRSVKQGIRSTKEKKRDVQITFEDGNTLTIPMCKHHDIFVRVEEAKEAIYTDQTGAFPALS